MNSSDWRILVTLNTGLLLFELQIPRTWINGSVTDADRKLDWWSLLAVGSH